MKKRIIFGLIAVLIAGVLFGFLYYFDRKEKSTDAYKFKIEYESLNGEKSQSGKEYRTLNISKNNRIKYSTAKEIYEKMNNNESFVVYFGFSKCPWCRSMVENLLDLAEKNNTDIYYVDVLEIRDVIELKDGKVVTTKKGDRYYKKLLLKMDNVLDDYILETENGNKLNTGEKRIYAPNVVAVVQGYAKTKVEGISEDLKDPYGKITDKMKKDSVGQLKCIFKCMEEAGVCTKPKSC